MIIYLFDSFTVYLMRIPQTYVNNLTYSYFLHLKRLLKNLIFFITLHIVFSEKLEI